MDFVGIDKFSLLDYDEMVSIVLFAPGCNFRCPFCHNLESVVDAKERIPFEQILTYLSSRVKVIDAVVISGGEPTLMPDLKEKIIAIRKLGYKIKLDTNGSNPKMLEDLINNNLLDYVAMDIKNSFAKYEETTSSKVNLGLLQKSIEILKENKVDYEFRTTLVKEFHDEQAILDMKEIVNGGKKLYLQKYVYREGMQNKNLHQVDEVEALKFKDLLQEVITTKLRGY